MYEFTCKYCGTVKIVKSKSKIGQFCSRSCKSRSQMKKPLDLSCDRKGVNHTTQYECRYNEAIICANRKKCGMCGWNPEVSQERLRRILYHREAVNV